MAFCFDNIKESYDESIRKKEFRKKYVDYCKNHKINVKSDYVIKRTLSEMFGASDDKRVSFGNKYEYIWDGITWKN